MLGDWGGQGKSPYYTKAEEAIAESMGKIAAQINSQFTVAMGDNFYPLGVSDVHDSRFQTTFEVGEVADVIHITIKTAARVWPGFWEEGSR